MCYKCISCNKPVVNFSCDCGINSLTWNRRERIDERKRKQYEDKIKNNNQKSDYPKIKNKMEKK